MITPERLRELADDNDVDASLIDEGCPNIADDLRSAAAAIEALEWALKAERAYHSNNTGENMLERKEALAALKELT